MDYIVIGLLIVLTSLVSAVLYACCVMSGKIDKLAEQRNVNEELHQRLQRNFLCALWI